MTRILVTGAGGEMGRLLIPALAETGSEIVALDRNVLPESVATRCIETSRADILDRAAMENLFFEHQPARVFHLAAVLSSAAEREPELAHRVNVDGTLQLIDICARMRKATDVVVRILFPSSIAVYGLPGLEAKQQAGAVAESEWTVPTGIYGCNKLYGELIGAHRTRAGVVDFRSIRFPGLISAETLPTGGTTDYAPEMIHAAARGESYRCFVSPGSTLPFMTMPDAVAGLMRLADADPGSLSSSVYNIRGFSASAADIRAATVRAFPDAEITYDAVPERQALVDSWPEDIDDSRAREDWGLDPEHDLQGAVERYLAPALRARYAAVSES